MILAIDAGNSRVKWGWLEVDKDGGSRWTSVATVSLIEFAASSDHVNPFSITHEAPLWIERAATSAAQRSGPRISGRSYMFLTP